ncbi:MAG: hypothetical protein ABEJ55_00010 [Halanaeroarchaeum sp.]
MATTGRTAVSGADESIAATVSGADVVHLVCHADGDSLAAAGLLAGALPDATAFQISTAKSRDAVADRLNRSTVSTVAIGFDGLTADATIDARSNARSAFDAATEFGDPDPTLGVAGVRSIGSLPAGDLLEAATSAGIERRPGVSVPTADLSVGLAFSTRVHADFSGDEQSAGAFLADLELPADLGDAARRRIASAVALDATEPPAPDGAAEAVEGALRPFETPDGPFETAEGYGDVLDVVARTSPGLATAMVAGGDVRTEVLDAWRETSATVHAAIRRAERSLRSGLTVVTVSDADPWTTARLVRDYRSGEDDALVIGADEVALATIERDARERLGSAIDPSQIGGRHHVAAAKTSDDPDAIVETLTEGP